jgi:endonuclease/exonuclease/phosphatase family metal-dependent hydrolase
MAAEKAGATSQEQTAREQQEILRTLAGPDNAGEQPAPTPRPGLGAARPGAPAEAAPKRRRPTKLRRAVAALGWLGIFLPLGVCLAIVLQVGRVPQLSLINYVPLYPVALVPVFAALLTRLRLLALPLGVAVGLWMLVLDGFGFGIGTINTPPGERIRIISYNIEDWHGPNKQGFYDLIDNRRPDLLALQEVWGPWDKHDHRWDPIRYFEWGDTDGRHVGLNEGFEPVRYDKLDEYGNAVLIEHAGRQFWVASVQYPRGLDAVTAWQFLPTETRREQERFAEFMVDWVKDKPDVIVIGDFNAVAHSWFMRALKMRNPWLTTGLGVGGTYKVDMPVARIDHVLIKGRITPLYSTTLHIDKFSNHRGLLFDFAIDDIPPKPLRAARPAAPAEEETQP